jgi:hypothetical protein
MVAASKLVSLRMRFVAAEKRVKFDLDCIYELWVRACADGFILWAAGERYLLRKRLGERHIVIGHSL